MSEHRQEIDARAKANAILAENADIIGAAVYANGQMQTAMVLRILSYIIEHAEFSARSERIH